MPQLKLKSIMYGVSLFLIFPTFLCLSEITKGQSNSIPADDPKVDNVENEEDEERKNVTMAVALYPFEGRDSSELTFGVGARIQIVSAEGDWWPKWIF